MLSGIRWPRDKGTKPVISNTARNKKTSTLSREKVFREYYKDHSYYLKQSLKPAVIFIKSIKKPISRKEHGIADWTYIPLTAVAPELLHFKADSKATGLARIMSGVMLGSALFTKAEWDVIKVIPFKAHLAADIGLGVFSLLAPWIFKFAKKPAARNTFLFIGLSGIIIGGLLTRRKEM
ncbi:hypothetical protein [Rubrolithibacter danxiaensis]|uniref:hypothetical protein n=1 Tax=Rubrolithibacter danxiaensis TaxID=3390805 RepID=UPI003BF7B1D5